VHLVSEVSHTPSCLLMPQWSPCHETFFLQLFYNLEIYLI
jgi:hypothetical protein